MLLLTAVHPLAVISTVIPLWLSLLLFLVGYLHLWYQNWFRRESGLHSLWTRTIDCLESLVTVTQTRQWPTSLDGLRRESDFNSLLWTQTRDVTIDVRRECGLRSLVTMNQTRNWSTITCDSDSRETVPDIPLRRDSGWHSLLILAQTRGRQFKSHL